MGEERRIAVVTGGNRGMGLEACRQLGRRGYHVVLARRDPQAGRSVEEGVATTVWLATLPDGGPSGQFFRDKQPIPW